MEILLHVYSGYLKTMLSFHVPDSTIPEKKWYYRIWGRNKTGNIYWESISIPIILPTKSWLEQKLQICTALSANMPIIIQSTGKHCSRNPQFRTDCSSRQKEADWQTYISEASGWCTYRKAGRYYQLCPPASYRRIYRNRSVTRPLLAYSFFSSWSHSRRCRRNQRTTDYL